MRRRRSGGDFEHRAFRDFGPRTAVGRLRGDDQRAIVALSGEDGALVRTRGGPGLLQEVQRASPAAADHALPVGEQDVEPEMRLLADFAAQREHAPKRGLEAREQRAAELRVDRQDRGAGDARCRCRPGSPRDARRSWRPADVAGCSRSMAPCRCAPGRSGRARRDACWRGRPGRPSRGAHGRAPWSPRPARRRRRKNGHRAPPMRAAAPAGRRRRRPRCPSRRHARTRSDRAGSGRAESSARPPGATRPGSVYSRAGA